MLCLSRKLQEKIVLIVPGYPPVEIQVTAVKGDRFKIAIEADRQIGVHREEVWEAIKREGEEE